MPPTPELAALLDTYEPPPGDLSIADFRLEVGRRLDQNFKKYGLPGPEVADVVDHGVAVAGGTITVRAYEPIAAGAVRGAHVVLHGGGWTTGSIDDAVCDATARHRAAAAGVVVFAVDYRLAPEHSFPTALDDVVAATRWIVEHASELGVDASSITVGGASAGANLAAALPLAAPTIKLRGMMLEVPAVDLTPPAVAASAALGADPGFSAMYAASVEHYLAGHDAADPLVSPLLASDLSGLPPTFLQLAGLDPLCADGERFADRLRAAGVPTTSVCYADATHGSPILNGVWPTARRWHDDGLAMLRELHGGGG